MNDRELLELAAKAAGMGELVFMSETERYAVVWLPVGSDCNDWVFWNPLTDDGDALRLAVKLAIDVNQGGLVVVAERRAVFDMPEVSAAERFSSSDEAYSATRRAIVRAAAEIGRAMP